MGRSALGEEGNMTTGRDMNRRFLGHETLETRSLLAGLVGDEACSAFQNPLDPNDLNADGAVTALDALVAINSINAGVNGDLSAKFAPPSLHGVVHEAASDFLDATGDGSLTAADALAVINTVNANLGPIRKLPLGEDQGSTIETAATLTFGRNFAKVLGAIDPALDVDVFKFTPTKTEISVAVFSARGIPLLVSIGTATETLETIETEADSRRPFKANLTVDPTKEYFITVRAADSAPAGSTGVYGLGVFNYSDDQFRTVTDAELGDDIHDGPTGTPTVLPLENRHAHVRSNIDTPTDVDSFTIKNVETGTLIIKAHASFPIEVSIQPLDSNLPTVAARAGTAAGVTAGTTYVVSVKSADGSTGPYSLNIVNSRLQARVHDPASALEALFARLDGDDDGFVTEVEVDQTIRLPQVPIIDRVFDNWDADDDLKLSFTEFEAGFEDLHERAVVDHPVRDFINRARRR
jgi:hypothetical protein